MRTHLRLALVVAGVACLAAAPAAAETALRPAPAISKMQLSKTTQARVDALTLKFQKAEADLANLEAQLDAIQTDIEQMSEMGEMQSLQLQMAMDRLSRMMSMMSNIMKQTSDTQQSIIQNIK